MIFSIDQIQSPPRFLQAAQEAYLPCSWHIKLKFRKILAKTRGHALNVVTHVQVCSEYEQEERTGRLSHAASFYHSHSWLLIEVEKDNDCIYSSTHLPFPSLALIYYPSSPSHPSSHPRSQGKSVWWPRLVVVVPQFPSWPAKPERTCVCVSLSDMCVSMKHIWSTSHIISSKRSLTSQTNTSNPLQNEPRTPETARMRSRLVPSLPRFSADQINMIMCLNPIFSSQIFCPVSSAPPPPLCPSWQREKEGAQSDQKNTCPKEFNLISCKFELIHIVELLKRGERLN